MFGRNEIIGSKYFDAAPERSMKVTSIFFTIQGEGPFTGRPAMFIRLAHCNLNCSFCDAYFDTGKYMNFEEIEAKMQESIDDYFQGDSPYWASSGKYFSGLEMPSPTRRGMVLVITGGEPMIQPNLEEFILYMRQKFDQVQIESNGTKLLNIHGGAVLVVSPKCSEKTGKYLTPNKEVLDRADCFKFIVSADPESPYHEIPDWAHDWRYNGKKVYISPMNMYLEEPRAAKIDNYFGDLKDRSTIDERISFWTPGLLDYKQNQLNHEYAAKYVMDYNFNLCLQTHLYASLP